MRILYNIDYIMDNLVSAAYNEKEDFTQVTVSTPAGISYLVFEGNHVPFLAEAAQKLEDTFIVDADQDDEDEESEEEEPEEEELSNASEDEVYSALAEVMLDRNFPYCMKNDDEFRHKFEEAIRLLLKEKR